MQTPTKTSTWCRTLGCYNYGNPQNRNLCNSCYQKLSERCPIRNCSNFGNKNTHGLCNECSKRFRFCTKCKRFGRPLPGDDTDAPVCLCDQNLLNPNEVRNDPVNGNWKPCKNSSCDNVSRDEEQFGLCMQCSDRFGFCKTCYGFFSAVPDFLINGHVCICEPKTNTNKPTDGDKGHISLAGNTVIVCKNRECTNYGSNKNAGLCYECAGLFKFCRTCQGFRVAVPSSVFNERWCSCVSATRDSTAEITTQGSGTNLNNTEAHVPAHVKSPETLRPIPPVETSNSLKYGMSELGYSSDITQRNLSCRGNSVTQRPVSGEVIYRECSESDCHKTGLESLGGRCATCYTLFKCVERNELKKSTQVAHKEILCSVPECNRPVSADLDGRCLYCHEAGRNGPQSQTSNSGLPHSFIESALGQQCATVPSKCTTPSCDRQVFRNCKCFSCYKELGKPCIVEGCLYFGSPDYHGKCSTCYNTNDVTSTFSMPCFPSASANITNDTPVTKKECSTPSCGFYGHPQQLDLCSECFQKHLSADVNPSRPSELSISREHQSSIPVLSIPYDSDFTSACARLGRLTIVSSPCQSECGNSCTTDTFPYCMECFNTIFKSIKLSIDVCKAIKAGSSYHKCKCIESIRSGNY
ncbi:uncharacterized protein LOC121378150 [Gigantopelta aegis]|uniref:uncharacterized protein LOC121378150 n=1 Tax=Gigantopelta aegis TaxID=1735272 RepID=UPI001B8873C7|nr:uncharacterized protein LOC121378150 [Gigantopelta aegis]